MSIDEIRDVADKAKAVALYLRSRNASIESQNDAAEIRMRAERRLGEISKAIDADGRGRPKKGAHSALISKTAILQDLNLTKRDASKWQALAAIPEKKFESFVADTRAKGERITSSAPRLFGSGPKCKILNASRAAGHR